MSERCKCKDCKILRKLLKQEKKDRLAERKAKEQA